MLAITDRLARADEVTLDAWTEAVLSADSPESVFAVGQH